MVIIANLGFPFPAGGGIKLLVKYNLCPKGIFRRKIFFFLCEKKYASYKTELKFDLIKKLRRLYISEKVCKFIFYPVAKMAMFFII